MDRIIATKTYLNGKKIAHEVFEKYPLELCKKTVEHGENGMIFVTYTAAVAQ